MLPRNLHFKTSSLDDCNAGSPSSTLRNYGHKTHRYHTDGESNLQEMVKTVQRKAILLVTLKIIS